jgi:carbonic anhydrase
MLAKMVSFRQNDAMEKSFLKILEGYEAFRDKYAHGDSSVMRYLSAYGQQPKVMIVACCDSRVDPALILQCDPGDLFITRNVANIVPPYEHDTGHHGTSAALEFGIRFLEVNHLILLGHSQCGGVQAALDHAMAHQNDFISNWVSILKTDDLPNHNVDDCAKRMLNQSYQNCLAFPWIQEKLAQKKLMIHLWFFDIHSGQIFRYAEDHQAYEPLTSSLLDDIRAYTAGS